MRNAARQACRQVRWAGRRPAGSASLWLLVLVTCAAAAVWPGSSTAADHRPSAAADPQLALPAPTGRWPVGVRSDFVADASRIDAATGGPRTLPVRVWYPARTTRPGPPAPYLSPAIQQAVEQVAGVPAGTLDLDTHASNGAPMRRRLRGVILVSPGFGNLVAFSTAQVIDLASRGWVVVTFDHPHDTYVVEQPDGTLIFSAPPNGEPDIERFFTERVVDVGVVLHNLRRLVPEAHRRAPVGMFGHSLGGAAAAEALLHYPRLQAGVDLDGTPFGRVVHEGLDEPFGIMLSTTRDQPGRVDVNLERFIANLRGPHPVRRLDIGHNGFTDFVVLNPQAMLVDPALGAQLEAIFAIGVDSVAEGTAALATQRRFLARFMGRHLRRCHGGVERDALPLAHPTRGPRVECGVMPR